MPAPLMIMMAAVTLDGRIEPTPLGSRQDRRLLEEMRLATGAGLMGAGTLRRADPVMAGPGDAPPPGRLRCIVTASGALPAERRLFTTGPRPVVFTAAAARQRLTPLPATVVVVPEMRTGGLDLVAVRDWLAGAGVTRVLVEGGGGLNAGCLAQGLIDEILLTVVPCISGHRDAAALVRPWREGLRPLDAFTLRDCRRLHTGEVVLRYCRPPGRPG